MSDGLKIQGEVSLSTEGAEGAMSRVGDKAEQMAGRLTREADKAGKAVDGIGSGAAKSADQFTRAEGRISDSIKRATTNLELLGKTASQKLEIRINERGLDAAKFEPMLAKLRELEAAQIRAGNSANVMASGMGPQFQNNLKNTSFQLQDMIVQMNGGVDATKALGQQLPQMLVGFGAAGAAVGVLAALLPNLVSAFSSSAEGAKDFKGAMSDFDSALGAVGGTVKSFDLENLYEEFNKSSDAARNATIEQLNFQREYIRTTQLVAEKSFGKSLDNFSLYGAFDNMAGGLAIEEFSKKLGVSVDIAKELLPALKGLKGGTEDFQQVFNKLGTSLLSGNEKSAELAISLRDMANAERDAAAASSAISEAQAKMAAGHVTTKKEADEAAKAIKGVGNEADNLAAILDRINGKESGLDATYWKDINALHAAYSSGKLSIDEYRDAVGKLTAAQKFNVDADKELAAGIKARSELVGKMAGDESKRADALSKGNEKLSDELALLGLTKQQQGEYSAAKLDAAAASDLATASAIDNMKAEWEAAGVMPEIIAGYEALAEAKRASAAALNEQAYLTRQHAAREVAVDQAKESAKAWKEFSRDIEQSLTDALYRSFESGGNFGETFARNLERTFKAMALKAAIQYVVSYAGNAASAFVGNATGGAAGNAGAAAGQWGGSLVSVGGKWIYQQASPYIDSAASYLGFGGSAAAVGSYAGYGTGIAASSSSGGLASSVYGSSMANATPAASSSAAAGSTGTSWLPIIGWIIAGMTAANSLSKQGYGAGGEIHDALNDKLGHTLEYSTGNVVARHLKALGMGDRGADILSAAPLDNNLANWLFGEKVDDAGSGLQLSIRDGQLASGANYQDWWSGGGRFHGSESGTNYAGLSGDQSSTIQAMLSGVTEGFIKPFNEAFATGIALNFDFRAGGEGFFKAIEAQLVKGIAESDVSGLFVGITDSSGMMAAIQTFANVQRQLETLNMTASIKDSGWLSVGAGSDKLQAGMAAYYEGGFFSAEERRKNQANSTNQALAGLLGASSVPKTDAEFRALVESLDLATESGRVTFAALMDISPAFDLMTDGLDAAAEKANRFNDSLAALRDSLFVGEGSGLTAAERYAQSKTTLSAVGVAAGQGEESALSALAGAVKEFIEASRDVAKTSLDMARDRALATSAINGAINRTVPGFADGGYHSGGVRIVGENGPEIELTGPSRIINNADSRALIDNSEVVAELRAVRAELATMRAASQATASSTNRLESTMRNMTDGGTAMRTVAA